MSKKKRSGKTSQKQKEANRENAKKSKGPRNTSRTKFNNWKHGEAGHHAYHPDENQAEILEHVQKMHMEWQPVGYTERWFLNIAAGEMWRAGRAIRRETAAHFNLESEVELDQTMELKSRYMVRIQKEIRTNLDYLMKLQALRLNGERLVFVPDDILDQQPGDCDCDPNAPHQPDYRYRPYTAEAGKEEAARAKQHLHEMELAMIDYHYDLMVKRMAADEYEEYCEEAKEEVRKKYEYQRRYETAAREAYERRKYGKNYSSPSRGGQGEVNPNPTDSSHQTSAPSPSGRGEGEGTTPETGENTPPETQSPSGSDTQNGFVSQNDPPLPDPGVAGPENPTQKPGKSGQKYPGSTSGKDFWDRK